jgi:DNA-binding NtrC family response regulator
VIVLDVKMPGIDGIETLRRIKAAYPLIEVVLLTGYGTIKSGIDGMKLGAYDYLTKPCDIETIVEKIEEASEKKRKQEEKIKEAERNDLLKRFEP